MLLAIGGMVLLLAGCRFQADALTDGSDARGHTLGTDSATENMNQIPAEPSGTRRTDDAVHLEVLTVHDPMVDNNAYRMLVPTGWKVDGGVAWRPNAANLAVNHMVVLDPTERMGLFFYPTDALCYDNSLAMYGFMEGSNYLGNEVRVPIQNVTEYVTRFMLPRYRPNTQARVVSTTELPKVATAVQAAIAEPGVRKSVLAAKVRVEYDFRGVPTEEDIFCTLAFAVSDALPTYLMWGPHQLYGFAAPKGQLDAMTPVFQTIAGSVTVDLEWYNKYRQVSQLWYQRMEQSIRDAGALSRYISQINDEITDINRSAWEHHQRTMDRVNRQFSEYIRGVQTYHNPFTQMPVQLPAHYNHVWANSLGGYVLTNSPSYNPNQHSSQNWVPLNPVP